MTNKELADVVEEEFTRRGFPPDRRVVGAEEEISLYYFVEENGRKFASITCEDGVLVFMRVDRDAGPATAEEFFLSSGMDRIVGLLEEHTGRTRKMGT